MFRINRLRALEAGIFASGFRANIDSIDAGHPEVDAALVASDTWISHAKEIHLLSVYEGRLTSILRKDRAELKSLQAERKEACEKAMNQAEIFVEHAESKGEIYDPGEDFQPPSDHGGFVFSNPEIARRRDRDRRYKKAWNYHFRDKSKDPRPDFGPTLISKPPKPHDGILKTLNSRNNNAPEARSVSSFPKPRVYLRVSAPACNPQTGIKNGALKPHTTPRTVTFQPKYPSSGIPSAASRFVPWSEALP